MSALFRRHSCIQCFFCNTSMPLPPNPRNFLCSACNCWNRYNERGEILSDEPAMHEEEMNRRSFMKRASPSKNQLPNIIRPGPFCRNCQTNQTLVINLLSNYLPAPEDKDYEYREKNLELYKKSLYERYPPVCEDCQPAVEEELYRKEKMAASKALDGSLSRGKQRARRHSGVHKPREKILETFWWKVRGALWIGSAVTSVSLLSLGLVGRQPLRSIPFSTSVLPVLAFGSILWMMWDPTYETIQKAQIQGRDVRVHGRARYCAFQAATWLSRLLLSLVLAFHSRSHFLTQYVASYPKLYLSLALIIEFSSLLAYPLCIRIQHPPPIRLIDTHAHRHTLSRSSTPATASQSSLSTPTTGTFPLAKTTLDSDLLASLTLSNKPVITPPRPVFGLPSLLSAQSSQSGAPNPQSSSSQSQSLLMQNGGAHHGGNGRFNGRGYTQSEPPRTQADEDEMDWSPTNGDASPAGAHKRKQQSYADEDSSSWLRPQRFFAPEKPTGLESLFERTKLVDDDAMRVDGEEYHAQGGIRTFKWKVWVPILVVLCILPVVWLYVRRVDFPVRISLGKGSWRSEPPVVRYEAPSPPRREHEHDEPQTWAYDSREYDGSLSTTMEYDAPQSHDPSEL